MVSPGCPTSGAPQWTCPQATLPSSRSNACRDLRLRERRSSTLDRQTLQDNPVLIGVAVFFMLGAAGFAIAARGPRALKARFWTVVKPAYGPPEERLAQADNAISHVQTDDTPAILESWRARRALSAYFAEAKALWVTCSLICLLLAFVSVGVAGLLLVV